MEAHSPSATAEAMAAARAFGAYLHRHRHILDDPYAEVFLSPPIKKRLEGVRRFAPGPLRHAVSAFYDRRYPGAVGWGLARHRYFDDLVSSAVAGGVGQVVLVGAGYDSRAWRIPELSRVPVVEIDHPATQSSKLSTIQRYFGDPPSNVRYVACDLSGGEVQSLIHSSIDPSRRALVLMEGLLWYLAPAAARQLLQAIAACIPDKSEVAFDYILTGMVDGSCDLPGARQHREFVASVGEPIQFGLDPGQLPRVLAPLSLTLVTDIGADELMRAYGRISMHPFFRIARARKLAVPASRSA